MSKAKKKQRSPRRITLQRIFNLAWQHFVVNHEPPAMELKPVARNYDGPPEPICKYLTADGRRCAVGLALPNGHPAQKEYLDLDCLIGKYPELFSAKLVRQQQDDDYECVNIASFQYRLHDSLATFDIETKQARWDCSWAELRAHYRKVAAEYKLKVPKPKPKRRVGKE